MIGIAVTIGVFDTYAQGRPRQWRSYSLCAGQLRCYAADLPSAMEDT